MAEGVTASIILWCIGLTLTLFVPFLMVIFQIYLETKKPNLSNKRGEGGETLLFRDITLCITTDSGDDKFLLQNVSGIVKPGEVCAIMGQSGAGFDLFL